MKRINLLTLAAAAVLSLTAVSCNTSVSVSSSTGEDCSQEWKALEQPLNFYIANDLGRNGYYDQKPIAGTMGEMAETIDIEFVVAAGDVHHFEGVQSVSDPARSVPAGTCPRATTLSCRRRTGWRSV